MSNPVYAVVAKELARDVLVGVLTNLAAVYLFDSEEEEPAPPKRSTKKKGKSTKKKTPATQPA